MRFHLEFLTVFTLAPYRRRSLCTCSLPLVFADAAGTAVFAPAPHPLVLTEAAAAAVFASAPLPLVFAQGRGLAGLLGCRRTWCWSCGQVRCIGWVHTTLFVLAVLSLWPSECVPLQHSFLACHGSLQAVRVIQHPTLRRIFHVETLCAINAVLPFSRDAPVTMLSFTRPLRFFKRRQYYLSR